MLIQGTAHAQVRLFLMCFRSQASTRVLDKLLDEYSSNKLSLSAALLVTMAEVDYARLTSLDRVTTGAGSVSRGARAKPNSLGRSLRPSSSGGVVSVSFYALSTQFTVRKYRGILVPNYAAANIMFTTMRCKMHVTNRFAKNGRSKAMQFLQYS